MLVTVFTGLNHFHCYLNVTQSLEKRNNTENYRYYSMAHIFKWKQSNCRPQLMENSFTSNRAIFSFSSSSVRMIGGVFSLENNIFQLQQDKGQFIQTALVHLSKDTATYSLPKVMRDAGVELVACFQQLTAAAFLFQTILDFLQCWVACIDLLCGQLACR